MTEIELELKLDTEGRTVSQQSGEGLPLDYSSKTLLTSLAEDSDQILFPDNAHKRLSFLDDLLFDCEITDCALLPRTFWVNCLDEPRCALEQCALEVFKHHVGDEMNFDPKTSGVEWWVQIRPSPPAGRYNLLVHNKNSKDESCDATGDDLQQEASGICFHWDKDEDLRLMMGGNMYIHPHISTVTYLTNIGAPTLALNYRVNPFTGEYMPPLKGVNLEAYVSWPKQGKHLSFDGRYLHAAPMDLMPDNLFESQIKMREDDDHDPTDPDASGKRNRNQRRHRRVTFLVNIWLNYKPFNVEPFPETMMDKMTKMQEDIPYILFSGEKNNGTCCDAKTETVGSESRCRTTTFKWPMGGCESKEAIVMNLPLESIQNKINEGGNVRVIWENKLKEEENTGVSIVLEGQDDSQNEILQDPPEQESKRPKLNSSQCP